MSALTYEKLMRAKQILCAEPRLCAESTSFASRHSRYIIGSFKARSQAHQRKRLKEWRKRTLDAFRVTYDL